MATKKTSDTGPALIKASRSGDLRKVKELIAQGADVNYDPPAGPPLWNAARGGHVAVMEELIRAGADINHRSVLGSIVEITVTENQPEALAVLLGAGAHWGGKGGSTPLLQAVTNNRIELAKALLMAGADVNETGSIVCGEFGEPEVIEEKSGNVTFRTTHVPNPPVARNATPLIVAVRRGYQKVVELLLEAGADAERADGDKLTAMAWAVKSGNSRLITLLESRGAKAPEFPEGSAAAAWLNAAKKGDIARLKEFLGRGVDVNTKHGTEEEAERSALMCAAEHGQETAVEFLIKAGANVNLTCGANWRDTLNKTALMYAAASGHAGIVRLLLKHKAKLNAKDREVDGSGGHMAIHYAAEAGHVEVIRILLEAGVGVDVKTRDGGTALSIAAAGGHSDGVKFLLQKGADVNRPDCTNFTPLAYAATGNHKEVVRILVRAGADPNAGQPSAIEVASGSDQNEIVQLLLRAGRMVGTRSKGALVDAATIGGPAVVKTLLASGADPNQANEEKFTALMGAVRAGNLTTIQLLLKAGANVNARNDQGETPLDLAYDNIKAARDQANFLKAFAKGKLDAETRAAIRTLENAGDTDEVIEALKAAGGKRGRECR